MVVSGRKLSNGDMAVAIGALVGFIAGFLPWYSVSFSCGGSPYCAGLNTSTSVGATASFWGWLFVLASVIAIGYIAARMFAASAIPALPLQDWMIFLILGAVMVAGALLYWLIGTGGASGSGLGYSAGVSFGLFIGLIAGAAVAVGGFLKKTEPQPATAPLNIQRAPQAPQYSAPPPAPQAYAAPPVQQAPPVAPPPQAPPQAPPAPPAQ